MTESIGKQSVNYIGWWQSGSNKTYIEKVTEDKGSDFKGIILKFGYLNQYSSRDKSKGWFRINNPRILYPKQGITWEEGSINIDVKLEIKENNNQRNPMFKGQVQIEESGGKFFIMMETESGKVPMINPYGYNTLQHAVASAVYKGFQIIQENTMVNEGPAQNNPKIQKIVDELNKIIESAKDSDGDPIGVVDTSSSWQEPYVYQPIQYKNGSLKIVSQSQYKNKPEVEIISKKDMEFEGIPTLKNILKMYRKAMKESGKTTNEGSMKRSIKEFREKGTKVTVKKEDNEFWLYQLGEDGQEECISNIGYKTEELANHAAFMKGFEVVNSKGTKEKIGFDELPDTRLPPKGTKAEPVKHEEPKYIDLGSEKKINLESLIRRIIKEEKLRISRQKKRISEADVTNTDLEGKAKRYAEIANKMKLLEEELKNLESEFTELDTEFRPLLEQVGKTKGTFIRAGKLLIKIEREGYDKKSKSYKTGFDYLYSKVNATMKDLADEALKMTETVSYVKSKISVVEEGIYKNWFTKIKSFFSSKIKKLFGLNNRANKELDELESKVGN